MRTQALATEFDFTAVDWPNGVNLGTWRAVELLGSGGTAEVWRAVAPDGREAALKLVKRELRRHPGANALLRRDDGIECRQPLAGRRSSVMGSHTAM